MFGDKTITGNSEKIVDVFGGFSLPRGLSAEQGDIAVLVYDEDIDTYKIYPEEKINAIMAQLELMALCAESKEESIHYKNVLIKFSEKVIGERKVLDPYGRIYFDERFKGTKFKLTGCGTHLSLRRLNEEKEK